MSKNVKFYILSSFFHFTILSITVVDISIHNTNYYLIILFYQLENSSESKWIPLHLQTLVLYKTNINQEKRKTPPSLCLSSFVLPPNTYTYNTYIKTTCLSILHHFHAKAKLSVSPGLVASLLHGLLNFF